MGHNEPEETSETYGDGDCKWVGCRWDFWGLGDWGDESSVNEEDGEIRLPKLSPTSS